MKKLVSQLIMAGMVTGMVIDMVMGTASASSTGPYRFEECVKISRVIPHGKGKPVTALIIDSELNRSLFPNLNLHPLSECNDQEVEESHGTGVVDVFHQVSPETEVHFYSYVGHTLLQSIINGLKADPSILSLSVWGENGIFNASRLRDMQPTFKYMARYNIITCIGAGNSYKQSADSALQHTNFVINPNLRHLTLLIGSIDGEGRRSLWSNQPSYPIPLYVAALGENLILKGYKKPTQGTSFACPFVAGCLDELMRYFRGLDARLYTLAICKTTQGPSRIIDLQAAASYLFNNYASLRKSSPETVTQLWEDYKQEFYKDDLIEKMNTFSEIEKEHANDPSFLPIVALYGILYALENLQEKIVCEKTIREGWTELKNQISSLLKECHPLTFDLPEETDKLISLKNIKDDLQYIKEKTISSSRLSDQYCLSDYIRNFRNLCAHMQNKPIKDLDRMLEWVHQLDAAMGRGMRWEMSIWRHMPLEEQKMSHTYTKIINAFDDLLIDQLEQFILQKENSQYIDYV